jgi:hypothetical protein
MLDPYTVSRITKRINEQIKLITDHICHGIDTIEQLQYSKGRLNALEALLQDLKDLQKENIDGDDEVNQTQRIRNP